MRLFELYNKYRFKIRWLIIICVYLFLNNKFLLNSFNFWLHFTPSSMAVDYKLTVLKRTYFNNKIQAVYWCSYGNQVHWKAMLMNVIIVNIYCSLVKVECRNIYSHTILKLPANSFKVVSTNNIRIIRNFLVATIYSILICAVLYDLETKSVCYQALC